jgi:hypothetical protein
LKNTGFVFPPGKKTGKGKKTGEGEKKGCIFRRRLPMGKRGKW